MTIRLLPDHLAATRRHLLARLCAYGALSAFFVKSGSATTDHGMSGRTMECQSKKRVLILAPSNLGLRTLKLDHEPGTWRAPDVLIEQGLIQAVRPSKIVRLERPIYRPTPTGSSNMLNASRIREFSFEIADAVSSAHTEGKQSIVVGGDCSVLLGALLGIRRSSPAMLIHIDGHSDFRHPGNYDPHITPGAVAGMDLALVTGRGEQILTEWPDVPAPLVNDEDVVQLGERESHDRDWAWPDIRSTRIEQIDIFQFRQLGLAHTLERIHSVLDRRATMPFWLHIDVDVLDERIMPAVDSPGRPGMTTSDLEWLMQNLTNLPSFAGLTLTVFDPDLDPTGIWARLVVRILREGLHKGGC